MNLHRALRIATGEIHHWQADTYVVSYPKSGRTWLRVLIAKAIAVEARHLDDIFDLNKAPASVKRAAPSLRFSHDWSGRNYRWPGPRYDRYSRKKVVFLARDPRDVVVSHFFQLTKRAVAYSVDCPQTMSEFIRNSSWGVERVVHFMNDWYEHKSEPTSFLMVRYEDLQRDPHKEL
ncbi:MAG TPA: sulfotransferase domain-containing protein, partial [Actinomycetota bacterium]|nr:sulfotransferase domain-containing protein [Actinomycetota bacterium]